MSKKATMTKRQVALEKLARTLLAGKAIHMKILIDREYGIDKSELRKIVTWLDGVCDFAPDPDDRELDEMMAMYGWQEAKGVTEGYMPADFENEIWEPQLRGKWTADHLQNCKVIMDASKAMLD